MVHCTRIVRYTQRECQWSKCFHCQKVVWKWSGNSIQHWPYIVYMIHSQFLKHTCSFKKRTIEKKKPETLKKKSILNELFFVNSWFEMYLSKCKEWLSGGRVWMYMAFLVFMWKWMMYYEDLSMRNFSFPPPTRPDWVELPFEPLQVFSLPLVLIIKAAPGFS